MAELIASATTDANSADFTVAAGSSATVFLKDAAGSTVDPLAVCYIQIKSAAGEYFNIGQITGTEVAKCVASPGTYRVNRPAQAVAVGVDQV